MKQLRVSRIIACLFVVLILVGAASGQAFAYAVRGDLREPTKTLSAGELKSGAHEWPVAGLPTLAVLALLLVATTSARARPSGRVGGAGPESSGIRPNLIERLFGTWHLRSVRGESEDGYEREAVPGCCDFCSRHCAAYRVRGPCCGSGGPGQCCDAGLLAQRYARAAGDMERSGGRTS